MCCIIKGLDNSDTTLTILLANINIEQIKGSGSSGNIQTLPTETNFTLKGR